MAVAGSSLPLRSAEVTSFEEWHPASTGAHSVLTMAIAPLNDGRVEALERVLGYLVTERQRLRVMGVGPVALEANRRAIVATQMRLTQTLGETYGMKLRKSGRQPPDQEEAAAR
jgi:hypothetical protein